MSHRNGKHKPDPLAGMIREPEAPLAEIAGLRSRVVDLITETAKARFHEQDVRRWVREECEALFRDHDAITTELTEGARKQLRALIDATEAARRDGVAYSQADANEASQ